MNKDMDKSLFFMTLSCVCIWIVVDVAMGKNYLGNFLGTIFPFMNGSSSDSSGSSGSSGETLFGSGSVGYGVQSVAKEENKKDKITTTEEPHFNGTTGLQAVKNSVNFQNERAGKYFATYSSNKDGTYSYYVCIKKNGKVVIASPAYSSLSQAYNKAQQMNKGGRV